MQVVAGDHPFHPLREQIKNLRRDSKSADLDTWMIVGLGALDTPYVREVGKRWMISMIARVDKPGCKADHVILLESPQGTGKSSALKTLAGGEEYFSDRLSDLGSKDSMLEMAGVWVIEMSEIPNLRGVALERFKAFISSTTDRFRPPYGRRIVKHPRQCVLAASTNSEEPFIDPTGTRRIWPVKCGNIDLDWLKQHREQLLAEARDCYLNGDKWWLETPELEAMAKAEQDERYQPGVWDETILDWIDNPEQRWIWIDNPELRTTDENKPDEGKPLKISIPVIPWNGSQAGKVTINDILIHGLSKDTARHSPPDRNQVANCLRHAGWKRRRDRTRGPSRDKGFYYSPERWKEERW